MFAVIGAPVAYLRAQRTLRAALADSISPWSPFSGDFEYGKEERSVRPEQDQTPAAGRPRGFEREESETVTAGGIVLPDTAKDKPTRGKVVSVGDGRILDNGKRSPLQVKVGDRVLFSSYAGDTFKLGTRELLLMREEDILAVIK